MIYLIGLGNNPGDISLSAHKTLSACKKILTKSSLVASFAYFAENNLQVESLDGYFENSRSFEKAYAKIAKHVLDCEKQFGTVAYCVEGSGLDDATSQLILNRRKNNIEVFCAASKSAEIEKFSPSNSRTVYSASDFLKEKFFLLPDMTVVINEIDSREIASEVKLKLSEKIGDETQILLFDKIPKKILVHELDRQKNYDYSTSILIYPCELVKKARFDFCDLVNLVIFLRSKDGCPWDRAQTLQSSCKNVLEEAQEVVDAINANDVENLCEELGDLLLQPIFLANIAESENLFSYYDILTRHCAKLISRHSYIFAGDKATTAQEALEIWKKNKKIEKNELPE